jgi:hypothetical protein
MTIRCDHCRGPLGLIIHLRMRFCSVKFIQAYQHHLEDLNKGPDRDDQLGNLVALVWCLVFLHIAEWETGFNARAQSAAFPK